MNGKVVRLRWNKTKYRYGLAVVILSFIIILAGGKSAHAAEHLFVPEKTQVTVGETFQVAVRVSDVQNLYGAPFHIQYPKDLLEIVRLEDQGFLRKHGRKPVFYHKIDDRQGIVIVGLSRLGDVSGVSGTGNLVILTFIAGKIGVANLSFRKVDFRDDNLQPVTINVKSARITIDGQVSKKRDDMVRDD